MAYRIKVNPNTVVKAIGKLKTLGIVESRQGYGTVVTERGNGLARSIAQQKIEERGAALLEDAKYANIEVNVYHRL